MLDPHYATRRRLKVGLVLAGAVAGAVFGIVLTRLGKLVTGAADATFANYAWNAVVFGVLSAIVSPLVSWASLRRAPLWRTVIEPLTWAVAGGATAVVVGIPALVLLLPPVGLVLGFLNLRRRYPDAAVMIPIQRGDGQLRSTDQDPIPTDPDRLGLPGD